MSSIDLPAPGPSALAPQPPDGLDSKLRSLVTVRRTHQSDAQQRQVIARLDDATAQTLMFGDEVTVEVQPGRHILRANNTLVWKQLEFTIEPGEHLDFQLINKSGRLTLGFLALLGVAPLYLSIERGDSR